VKNVTLTTTPWAFLLALLNKPYYKIFQNIEYYASTTRVEVDVIHPDTDKFTLEIIVYGFSSPAAFILDNLEYEAELCEDLQANEIQHPRQPQLPPTTTVRNLHKNIKMDNFLDT
jgi:hypothetical protein